MTNGSSIKRQWLATVPPTFFGAIMGITGLGLAWRRAEDIIQWPSWPGDLILLIGAAILLLMLPAYGLKYIYHKEAVLRDLAHPVKGPFLGGMPLAILLQVPALHPIWPEFAIYLWLFGATFSLAINLYIFSRWFLLANDIKDYNAIWLIPGVGSFIVALTGVPIGYLELCWFFFSLGLVFWLFLSAILIHRYMFYPKHVDPLVPSYFLPIVPPGLISMIYPLLVVGDLAPFTRVIYYFALFLLIFNLAMFKIFARLKFSMGWWAYTFPLDTITSATLVFAASAGLAPLGIFGKVLLVVSTFVIFGILLRTLFEIAQGRVFVPDPPAQPSTQP